MNYILRRYQELAADAGFKSLTRVKNNEMIMMPTGSGKSLVIGEMCNRLNDQTLILQPTKEILEQNYEKLLSYGITDIGIYSASMNRKDIAKYTYATIGSIFRKPELFNNVKYVLYDECHTYKTSGGMYKTFFKAIGNPSVVGLTASPYRLVQKYYQEDADLFYTSMLQVLNRIHPFFFKSFAFKVNNQRLFDEKYLCPIDYIYPERIMDVSDLKLNTNGADFDEEALEQFVTSRENVQKVIEAVISVDEDTPNNLIFCSSIKHAHDCANLLGSLGYDSEVLTSHNTDKERDDIITRFRAGEIRRLFNVGIFTTGFDFPGLYCVTLARPTMSLALYYQIAGRLVRLDPNNPLKRGKFVDVTRASKRMGRIETIRITKSGFKDRVETEVGVVSGVPLFTFRVTNKEKIRKLSKD